MCATNAIATSIDHGNREPNPAGAPAPEGIIPVAVPCFRGREWEYLKQCLDTNWVSSAGPFVERFEQVMAEYTGTAHAVAVSSGTAALHTALMVAGIKPDDEVLVSDFTFIAPANAIRHAGAWPVFIDASADTWQMDPDLVYRFLSENCVRQGNRTINRQTGRTVSAIIPVHILGHPVDMDPIMDLAAQYDLIIIEDAAESLGATYGSRQVGSMGKFGCFSFNGNKLITSGGGGMLVTDDLHLARKARHITSQAKMAALDFRHDEVGYNYRLTNIQAALGLAQLEQVDEFLAAKRAIAAVYTLALGDVPGISTMPRAPWADSTWWLYTILVDPKKYGHTNLQLMQMLKAEGISTQARWQPLHETEAHKGAQAVVNGVSKDLHLRALTLPCSVNLKTEQAYRISKLIRKFAK